MNTSLQKQAFEQMVKDIRFEVLRQEALEASNLEPLIGTPWSVYTILESASEIFTDQNVLIEFAWIALVVTGGSKYMSKDELRQLVGVLSSNKKINAMEKRRNNPLSDL